MDTDEDPEGKAREAEGKACGKGPVLTPRHPPAWLPGGSASLTIHRTSAADYTPALSGGQFSPSLAPVLGVVLKILATPGISSDQGTVRYQLSN